MRLAILSIGLIAAVVAYQKLTPSSGQTFKTQKLTVQAKAERVVLAWSGPIAEPMSREIAAALLSRKDDPRPIVLSLNSPGGSIHEGREVMRALRDAGRLRRIDTRVENGGVCASMCVAIYLLGTERTADPGARFMFHEASLRLPAEPGSGRVARAADGPVRTVVSAPFTDILFERDFDGPRVNARWLRDMRRQIVGRDVWVSARQLVDEGSGMVDALSPTVPR
ncbi:MAG: ATP-dependent Clp protease proteolytic subunit [Methylobacteriaceae bacterium]|nr:ATP-dependent Clp protease proteolytic subunit [Methylobacteriaceae bacterium]